MPDQSFGQYYLLPTSPPEFAINRIDVSSFNEASSETEIDRAISLMGLKTTGLSFHALRHFAITASLYQGPWGLGALIPFGIITSVLIRLPGLFQMPYMRSDLGMNAPERICDVLSFVDVKRVICRDCLLMINKIKKIPKTSLILFI